MSVSALAISHSSRTMAGTTFDLVTTRELDPSELYNEAQRFIAKQKSQGPRLQLAESCVKLVSLARMRFALVSETAADEGSESSHKLPK